MLILDIIILLSIICYLCFYNNKQKKKYQKEIDSRVEQVVAQQAADLNGQIQSKKQVLNNLEESYTREAAACKQKLQTELELEKTNQLHLINKELEEGRNDCTADYLIWYKTFDEIKNKNLLELDNLQLQIADFQSKQQAINAKIQQERLSAEESKRFCILLSDESLQDINLLLNLRTQFFKKDTLSKIVWSEYIQPAFKEMLKRQFGATIPKNVIYCIENLDTNEKYIGKTSQEVGKRWSDHIKSSLSIGTNSNSLFHQALYKNWDNFKFTVLEEVNTNALTEREKFYISLYQTDIYGYNMKVG